MTAPMTPITDTEETISGSRKAAVAAIAAVAVAATVQTASAQGYDPSAAKPGGITMPPQGGGTARPAVPTQPITPPGAPSGAQPGEDPRVAAAGDQRLPPELRNMRDQVPPNSQQLAARLGLRSPRGQRTDLRGRTPSAQELVNALAPRR